MNLLSIITLASRRLYILSKCTRVIIRVCFLCAPTIQTVNTILWIHMCECSTECVLRCDALIERGRGLSERACLCASLCAGSTCGTNCQIVPTPASGPVGSPNAFILMYIAYIPYISYIC